MLDAIFAVNQELGMGYKDGLPWGKPIPSDMINFRERTLGRTVIMGRKTFFSLPEEYRPLPSRKNVVITTKPEEYADEYPMVKFVSSVDDIIQIADESNMPSQPPVVIGGPTLLNQLWGHISSVTMTLVYDRSPADAYFPKRLYDELFDIEKWRCRWRRYFPSQKGSPQIDIFRFYRNNA